MYVNEYLVRLITSTTVHTSEQKITETISNIKSEVFNDSVILYGDTHKLLNIFKDNFKFIEAAGGIIQNKRNNYLFIVRWNKWDLPKGKLDKGETPKEAAIREVCEETGIKWPEIDKELESTFHIYFAYDNWFLKKTYWYKMYTNENTELIPAEDEDITEVVWMNTEEAKNALSNSYGSLKDTFMYLFD